MPRDNPINQPSPNQSPITRAHARSLSTHTRACQKREASRSKGAEDSLEHLVLAVRPVHVYSRKEVVEKHDVELLRLEGLHNTNSLGLRA